MPTFAGLGISVPASAALADAGTNPTTTEIGADLLLFNGTTRDRARNNLEFTVQASTARTANVNSADQTNYNHRAMVLFYIVTAVSGTTPSLTPQIDVKDSTSGTRITIITQTAITTVSNNVYGFSVPVGANYTANSNWLVPRNWRTDDTISGTTPSFTYSIGGVMLL